MRALIQAYADRMAEREAERLLQADMPIIHRWERGVTGRVQKRKGSWANVAYLRMNRARRYA